MRLNSVAVFWFLLQSYCLADQTVLDSLKKLTYSGSARNKAYHCYEVSVNSTDTSEIIGYINQAQRFAAIKDDPELTVMHNYAMGRYFLYLQYYDNQNKIWKDSASYYLKKSNSRIYFLKNKVYQAGLLVLIGSNKSVSEYNRFIDSANKILFSIQRQDIVIDNLKRIGYKLFESGYKKMADSIMRERLNICSRDNNHDNLLVKLVTTSKNYESIGEFQLAIKLLNDYRWLINHTNDLHSKWDYYYKKSIFEWHINEFLLGIKSCDTSLIYANKLGKVHEQSLSYELLGIIYNELQMWDQAIEQGFHKALILAKKISNDTTISRLRMNIAASNMDRQNFKEALKELLDNKELFKNVSKVKRDDSYFVYLFNILECYFFLGMHQETKIMLRELDTEFIDVNKWSSVSQYYLAYARYYFLLKDYPNSEKYLQQAWSNYNFDVGLKKLAEGILSIYHIVFMKQGKFADAYKYALEWSYMKDSINAEIDSKEMGRFEKEQEVKLDNITQQIEKQKLEDREKANTRIIIFLIIAAIVLIIFTIIVYRERVKSEKLLLNILPKSIALRLKKKENYIAERFQNTSVMFIDIANFTKLSSGISPEHLVAILNDIFTKFDELSDKHGLEKIKTIGDCYLAVAGIPEPKIDHAFATADMALELMRTMKSYSTFDGLRITFRIGIDCGPVVAGIIGKNKFIYDLWGDTVNTASRMEDYGVVGEIQVSDRFKKEIDSSSFSRKHYYQWIDRGLIDMKGKGNMKTWLLREPE